MNVGVEDDVEEYPREKGLENQVTEFKYRLTFIEKDLLGTKQQLQHYVSTKENDLQLKNIQITVNLIE